MSTSQGRFVWYELMTTDAAAATAFYAAVIGWSARDGGLADRPYTILNAGEVGVGGVWEFPASMRDGDGQPRWIGYVGVPDVDGFVARTTEAGGEVHRPAEDIPGVGRFAVVADPQGAAFVLFRPGDGGPVPPPAGATPGRIGWHELYAKDREAAFAFYAGLFGWTKGEGIDMGPMGLYQIFAVDETQAGGMMTRPDPTQRTGWLYYINVEEIGAAVARVKEHGGQVIHGPQQVPGGSWIAQGLDPQGAAFAVVAPPG